MPQLHMLVTGFLPFGPFHENPSQVYAEALGSIGPLAISHAQHEDGIVLGWTAKILSVDEKGSSDTIQTLLANCSDNCAHFDAVLHLGLSNAAFKFELEGVGRNVLAIQQPDASGRLGKIDPLQPDCLPTTALLGPNAPAWRDLVDGPDSPCVLSTDAGSYWCNETYFRTLRHVYSSKLCARSPPKEAYSQHPLLPVLFVHVPPFSKVDLATGLCTLKQIAAALINGLQPSN